MGQKQAFECVYVHMASKLVLFIAYIIYELILLLHFPPATITSRLAPYTAIHTHTHTQEHIVLCTVCMCTLNTPISSACQMFVKVCACEDVKSKQRKNKCGTTNHEGSRTCPPQTILIPFHFDSGFINQISRLIDLFSMATARRVACERATERWKQEIMKKKRKKKRTKRNTTEQRPNQQNQKKKEQQQQHKRTVVEVREHV